MSERRHAGRAPRPPFSLTPPEPFAPGAELHLTVLDAVQQYGPPGFLTMHPAYGAEFRGGWREWRRLERMGARAGWPDLTCFHEGRAACLEIKDGDAVLSRSQRLLRPLLDAAGVPVFTVRSPGQALWVLRREMGWDMRRAWQHEGMRDGDQPP